MKIDLRELKDGENVFEFDETPEDLHIQDGILPIDGTIHSRLMIYKIDESITAKGESTCNVLPECARCLEPIPFVLEVAYTFVFRKGQPQYQEEEDDETLIFLNEGPDEIDLGNEVKDYILLELPMIPTCAASPNGPCDKYDQPPIQILGAKQEERLDPRWDALRALNNPKEQN